MSLHKGLTIGELSKRTGIGVSTLRAWERRYGFPAPPRVASGHRRYRESDVETLVAIVRDRAEGVKLATALSGAREDAARRAQSLYDTVADVVGPAVVLSRAAMLALSHAIEDEAALHADAPVFVGSFQSNRRWSTTRPQWRLIARRAAAVLVMATGIARRRAGSVWQVALPPTHPMAHEWTVICDSATFSACLVGRERHGIVPREFDAVWTTEPDVVRLVLDAATEIATNAMPEFVPPERQPAADATDAARHATLVAARALRYRDGVVRA